MRLKMYRGKWCAYWREGNRPRRVSLRTADRDVAEQRLADLQKDGPRETCQEIYNAYLEEKRSSVKSIARIEDAWKALKPHFGALRPDQVTRPRCREYAQARQGRANSTINKELRTLRAVLRWHDKHTPAVFEMPPNPPPRERHLTKEEYIRLLDGAEGAHVKLFITLALATAGRSTAILELTWDRVDFARGVIRLGTGQEGRKGRATVPMTKNAREALETAYEARLSDYVVEWNGAPVKSIKKGFARACERAGLEGVSPHVLRHTAAVWMAEAGTPMSVIAQYLGHSDSRITERVYARFSPEFLAGAASALNV